MIDVGGTEKKMRNKRAKKTRKRPGKEVDGLAIEKPINST